MHAANSPHSSRARSPASPSSRCSTQPSRRRGDARDRCDCSRFVPPKEPRRGTRLRVRGRAPGSCTLGARPVDVVRAGRAPGGEPRRRRGHDEHLYGQLAGALYGEKQIPGGWRNVLAMCKTIKSFADRLNNRSVSDACLDRSLFPTGSRMRWRPGILPNVSPSRKTAHIDESPVGNGLCSREAGPSALTINGPSLYRYAGASPLPRRVGPAGGAKFFALGGVAIRDRDWHRLRDLWQETLTRTHGRSTARSSGTGSATARSRRARRRPRARSRAHRSRAT